MISFELFNQNMIYFLKTGIVFTLNILQTNENYII